jgi:DNA-binding NtrC family response regulator
MASLKKILVVDDEAGIRRLLFELLSNKGFRVTLAKDGKDSLAQMRNRRFDLLITDINMPRLDGIELLRRMKKEGRRERVIVMTGSSMNKAHFGKDTPDVFTMLQKPFHMNNFLDTVTSVLSQPVRKGGKSQRAV